MPTENQAWRLQPTRNQVQRLLPTTNQALRLLLTTNQVRRLLPTANQVPPRGTDTAFLFDLFLEKFNHVPPKLTVMDTPLYERPTFYKVLLLGSGGLFIGQASTPTSKGLADKVYFVPVRAKAVPKIIKKVKPDGILIDSIIDTEDRDKLSAKLDEIG
ncbi:hypothetical protein PR003_g31705 [Phytophthora rubi]|uniref:Uncharacterized protein n=1 Tax=Phytophthora rubi TaxID=129364 RepID=A0A6A4B602_9STRA|nr:hypothetical protein PR001_g30453 [Phytophthora rubi]KAE9267654.1 hypothetical protein PR003_g31705 [Phytophthora rubi]